jgi:putative hydrolase of the HAD superfamily
MTLIRPNPAFKIKRAEAIARMCNLPQSECLQIQSVVIEQDLAFDRYNEMTGRKAPARYMYHKVLEKIKPGAGSPEASEYLFNESNRLFADTPPLFLHRNVPAVLSGLHNEGISLNIGSNTGYIEGPAMRLTIEVMDVAKYFSFMIFSDEVGVSKPSPAFFGHISREAGIPEAQILHVGDNLKADYHGALRCGLKAMAVANQYYTIDDIKQALYA